MSKKYIKFPDLNYNQAYLYLSQCHIIYIHHLYTHYYKQFYIYTIPNVCTNARLSIGSTQEAVDQYDICIMTEAAFLFGCGKLVLLLRQHTNYLLSYWH